MQQEEKECPKSRLSGSPAIAWKGRVVGSLFAYHSACPLLCDRGVYSLKLIWLNF
jgi:hypothetical protein